MAHCRVFGKFEVEVNLHATVVGVGRHGVPGAAGLKLGHSHLKLAAGHDLLDEQTVDGALVGFFEGAEMHHYRILLGHLLDSGLAVGGGGAEVEAGGLVGRVAPEGHMAVAASYIECLLVVEMILLITDEHASGTAYIDDSELTALGEPFGAQDVRGAQQQLLLHGHGSSGYDAVEHGVYHVDLVGCHDLLHQIFLADARGVIVLRVKIARRLAYFAVEFHGR